ncbi:signal recognition particle-docking protein FtsY [Ningiella sp. W23]|uniref:signal recognition particle-docking protein FtsY n=1 Tax=Ningiella sp. W23 TaxID=3023715 RepID=UPI0037570968
MFNWFKNKKQSDQKESQNVDEAQHDSDIPVDSQPSDQSGEHADKIDETGEQIKTQAPSDEVVYEEGSAQSPVKDNYTADNDQNGEPEPELAVKPEPEVEAEQHKALSEENMLNEQDIYHNEVSDSVAERAPESESEVQKAGVVDDASIDKDDAQSAATDASSELGSQKQGFFSRLKSSLTRTKENIGSGFVALLKGKSIDDELYEDLETQLLVADVGMRTTSNIIENLTSSAKLSQLRDGDALLSLLKQQMRNILEPVSQPLDLNSASKAPFVILMVGVNGVGKTTTIGKLAKQFQKQGKRVMLAAGDTFRAAAVEQLQVWGERNDIPVISQPTGADSASVIFDALASAQAKGADVLIADTAGRLQNKDNLIEELKKVVRVMKKQIPDAPHEIMLTLDASTGQNAVSQTKIFNEAVGITGINLTKLDGTAKGGVIFALADEFKIPLRYIGIGEGIDDLRPFESDAFVDALFDDASE